MDVRDGIYVPIDTSAGAWTVASNSSGRIVGKSVIAAVVLRPALLQEGAERKRQ